MATIRQIAANQKNAQRSTGPVTDEGKIASRGNALKHGLTGAGVVVSDDDLDALRQRMIEWRPNYQPRTPEQEWLFERMVAGSIKLDRCQQQESRLRSLAIQRATLCWDEDRWLEAEEIAEKLSKRPALICQRLQKTKQGVDWLIARWRILGAIFERQGEWTEAQNATALDLMGTPPELRDEAPIEDPAALVAPQISRLKKRLDQSLDALDVFERAAAVSGNPITLPKALSNLRRYEATCRRQYLWALDRLNQSLQALKAAEPTVESATSSTQNQTRWESGQGRVYPAVPTSARMPETPHHSSFEAFHPQS